VLVVVQEQDVRLIRRKSFGGVEERSGAERLILVQRMLILASCRVYRDSDKALKSKGGGRAASLHAAFGG
jgi:hypothetical protein